MDAGAVQHPAATDDEVVLGSWQRRIGGQQGRHGEQQQPLHNILLQYLSRDLRARATRPDAASSFTIRPALAQTENIEFGENKIWFRSLARGSVAFHNSRIMRRKRCSPLDKSNLVYQPAPKRMGQ
jgi:hypothetical protein